MSALPKEVPKELTALSRLPTESLLELFRFVRSNLSGGEALCVEEKQTLWNPIVNVGVATVDKRSIDEALRGARQECVCYMGIWKKNGGRVWISRRRALHDV